MKMVDMISAAFAAGEMPNSEGMVDKEYARAHGYLVLDKETIEASAPPSPDEAAESASSAAEPASEFSVQVVRVRQMLPIPDADRIMVAKFVTEDRADAFVCDYPVVVQKEGWTPGDVGVYVPVDAVLPDVPEFSFLGSDIRRLRAKRLRGVYSEGLLVPLRDVAAIIARAVPPEILPGEDANDGVAAVLEALTQTLQVGDDLGAVLGITKWTPPTRGPRLGDQFRSQKQGPDESVCPVYSVSNAKKGEGLQYLSPETRVIVTEKLHGANVRFGVRGTEGGFFLGSHRQMREPASAPGAHQDWFQRVCGIYDLESKFSVHQYVQEFGGRSLAVYGEVLGVQDLGYGYSPSSPGLRVFDVYDLTSERWLDWGSIVTVCRTIGLDHAPVLYDGPLDGCHYRELAEGPSTVSGHIREGVVLRTFAGGGPTRRWKYVGEGYRTRKGKQSDDTGE